MLCLRLVAGVLQLAQGTHLTIDETRMQNGTLTSNGVENARLLKHLLEWQKLSSDFLVKIGDFNNKPTESWCSSLYLADENYCMLKCLLLLNQVDLLMTMQVEYDFEYYKLEMAADVQLLIISEGKSNILPADLVLPFCPKSVASEISSCSRSNS
ncbi:hypothetical protein GW17_00056849 [Ensete ventricosum]|nr:hypothetical protein GW17_00056849 [Ensete ventricosum]